MNKTLSVNIGGYVFNIEEDAYERLQKYLEAIAHFFHKQNGADEIMADIEARIAELFNAQLEDGRQVVLLKDVEHVISVMGRPEEVAGESAEDDDDFTDATSGERRLYRDPENAVLGGVCAGLGHYLGWDPVVVRIIFAVMAFFGFAGIPIYIILWVAMPEARSTAEKLRMKGQKINVENISKSFNDGFENAKSSFRKMSDERNLKSGIDKVLSVVGELAAVLLKVLKSIFGVALILLGIGLIVGVVLSFAGVGQTGQDVLNYDFLNTYIFFNENNLRLAIVAAILLITVPIIAFFYGGLRALMNTPLRIPGLSVTLFVLLVVATIAASFVAVYQVREHSRYEEVTSPLSLPADVDTLHVVMLDDPYWHNQLKQSHGSDFSMMKMDGDRLILGCPVLRMDATTDDELTIEFVRGAHAKSVTEALTNAEEITYDYQLRNDTLFLPAFYSAPADQKFRSQSINVNLLIPDSMVVSLDRNVARMVLRGKQVDGLSRSEFPSHSFTTLNGELRCTDCGVNLKSEPDSVVRLNSDLNISVEVN